MDVLTYTMTFIVHFLTSNCCGQ